MAVESRTDGEGGDEVGDGEGEHKIGGGEGDIGTVTSLTEPNTPETPERGTLKLLAREVERLDFREMKGK